MLETIKNFASSLFTDEIFTKLTSSCNENELLETFVYEISLGVTNANVNKSIEVLDLILSYAPLKRYIVNRCIEHLNYPTIAITEMHSHFNIQFDLDSLFEISSKNPIREVLKYNNDDFNNDFDKYMFINRIFREDLVDEFTTLFDKAIEEEKCKYRPYGISFELDVKRIIWLSYEYSIRFEAVRIFKYLYMNYDITKFDSYTMNHYIFNSLMFSSNHEIAHLLEQKGINFSAIPSNLIYNCHHYDIIEWIYIHEPIEDVSKLKNTDSLVYHFLHKSEIYPSCAFKYDLSCVPILKQDAIYHNCFNIIMSGNFKYNTHDLQRAIYYNHFELFKEMIIRIENRDALNFFVLKEAIQNAIVNETIEFIKLIIEKDFEINSDKQPLILQKDNSKNNIIHLILENLQNLIRVVKANYYRIQYEEKFISTYKEIARESIKFIKEKLTKSDYKKLMNEKDNKQLSCMQYLSQLSLEI